MTPTINDNLLQSLTAAVIVATCLTAFLLVQALKDFTRAGPQLRNEIRRSFRLYLVYAVLRLTSWAFATFLACATLGALMYWSFIYVIGWSFLVTASYAAAIIATTIVTASQFLTRLLHAPSSIVASWPYRMSRLYPSWELLTPGRIKWLRATVVAVPALMFTVSLLTSVFRENWFVAFVSGGCLVAVTLPIFFSHRKPRVRPTASRAGTKERPNVVMIGADTLRVDRIGKLGYVRNTTPFIDTLADRGTLFTNCYVPLARTAPSLISMFTGAWPHRHGIRDNFAGDKLVNLPVEGLAAQLGRHGYTTATIADWAGADFGKFSLGFDEIDVPDDQWNLKYYLRQGPMLLRLFLSLFFSNTLGKRALPEIYYLAGNPLTSPLAEHTCREISKHAKRTQPFLLNLFISTTHVPFGSEYPYYLEFADPAYRGDSKFVMTALRDPNEIIAKQEAPGSDFDLTQISNLYDGCVRNFDAAVERVVRHIEACGISDRTIIVIYSDHGADFFENQTWGQGNTVAGFDHAGRIPVLFVDPRYSRPMIIDDVTRSVDIAPTLLDLCGTPVNMSMDGVSLRDALKTGKLSSPLTAYQETGIWLGNVPGMHSEHVRYPGLLDLLEVPNVATGTLAIKEVFHRDIVFAKDRMVREGKWKLVRIPLSSGPKFFLFDTTHDPDCLNDVSLQYPAIYDNLKNALAELMKNDRDLQPHSSS